MAATVKIKKGQPVVKASREGLALDRAAVERQLATAFVEGGTVTGKLPVSTARPAVSTADARAAADQAAAFLTGPLTLTYKDRSWVIPADKLAGYLAFVPGDSPKLRATFASPTMEGYFRFITAQIGVPAKDASFKIVGNRVRVVRGKPGVGVAEKLTVRNIEAAAQQSGSARTAALVIGKARPELTYEKAKALKITRRIGTYTTSVSGSSGRLHNVGLGAAMLSNALVAPGKVFSVNATTGERTAAKGYEVAPVIINGQLEDSIGGGMCQVSTTLFNAAFEAGLQIVERTNHSLYISHYPLGRDATVSYGSYDLKFRNDTKNWILVKSTFTGYSLNVLALRHAAAPEGHLVGERLVRLPALPHGREEGPHAGEGQEEGRDAGRLGTEHHLLPQGLRRRRQAALERHLREPLPGRPASGARGDQGEGVTVAQRLGHGEPETVADGDQEPQALAGRHPLRRGRVAFRGRLSAPPVRCLSLSRRRLAGADTAGEPS